MWKPQAVSYEKYEEYFKSITIPRVKETVKDSPPEPEPTLEPIKHCKDFRTKNDILLIIKTGATEVHEKLPVHFKTTFKCPQDYLVFSDVAQEFNGIEIHDALDHMKDMVDRNTDEWRFKEALEDVRANKDPKEYRSMSHSEGWKLDKFKNLPMLLKSYKKFPDKKWYFFIDADTAIIWSNLLTWLSKFDSNRPYYMGSQSMIGDLEFGHGGSGYAISQAAARKIFDEDAEQKRAHHQFAMQTCCGDLLISKTMVDNGIHLYRSWPIIQGEPPATVDFGDYHWNKPAVTFHHMSPQEVEDVYYFEQHQRLQRQRPPTHEDVFEYFVTPKLTDEKDNWDNNLEAADTIKRKGDSSDWDKMATGSYAGCREACLDRWDCLQFTYWKDHCSLSTAMRLGKKRKGRKAGWNIPRIERWKAERANKTTDWMLDYQAHD